MDIQFENQVQNENDQKEKISHGKYAQHPADVKVFQRDIAGCNFFFKAETGDQEAAQHKKYQYASFAVENQMKYKVRAYGKMR